MELKISPESIENLKIALNSNFKRIDEMYRILTDAKVNYVSQLVGKPVEVTIEDNTFKDFRILT